MTAAENSLVGLAKQTGVGVPNVTDASFNYFLFSQGGIAPNNVVIPLDQEVGGGAMIRDVKKMGVHSVGQYDFIPRPDMIGHFLMGVMGKVTTTLTGTTPNDYNSHKFSIDTNQFTAPYYTFRSSPGGLWGEQFQDCRISGLTLNFKGANFLRASASILGGLPAKVVTTTWAASPITGAQYISPVGAIELPSGTSIKVLAGSFTAGVSIPLDEQWIVGSYTPDALDINSRAYSMTFTVKIVDATLYSKMMYDPSAGSAWLASMFKDGSVRLDFLSDTTLETGIPFKLSIAANATNKNMVWSTSPIGLRAGKQVIANITGLFLADADPIDITLLTEKTISF